MYNALKYYQIEKQVETARIGKVFLVNKLIDFPAYISEIKSGEDLKAVLNYNEHFPKTWPISIHSGHYVNIMKSMPEMLTGDSVIQNLLLNRHFIFYEPNEFYRYCMPLPLVSHVFKGNISQTRRFWKKALEEGDRDAALKMIPIFERRFLEPLWDRLIYQKYQDCSDKRKKKIIEPQKPDGYPKLDQIWLKIDNEYFDKVIKGLHEASIPKSASYIPPVMRLVSSSDQTERNMVVRMNKASAFLWNKKIKSKAMPWLSIYADHSCFSIDASNSDKTDYQYLEEVIQQSFDSRAHVGIAVTITGWENIKKYDSSKSNLIAFIQDISDFASLYGVPLFLPRGGYYALEMIDQGAAFFGSLLNGNPRYPPRPGGSADPYNKYGKIIVYRGGEWSFNKMKTFLKNKKNELPKVPGLPRRPYPEYLDDDKRWRINYSKPMRMGVHSREINEIVNDMKKRGTRKPAKRYLEGITEIKYY